MAILTTAEMDRRLRAVELYRSGQSLRAVASAVGVTSKTVWNWFRAMGVARRAYGESLRLAATTSRASKPRPRRKLKVAGACERCGLLLAGSTNANASCLCDVCDAELRAGRLYGCEELSKDRREALGYSAHGLPLGLPVGRVGTRKGARVIA